MARNQYAIVPTGPGVSEVVRESVKRKVEDLSKSADSIDDCDVAEYCGGWPVGSGDLYCDNFVECTENWVSNGCMDFVQTKTAKFRYGTHQIRSNVFYKYSGHCNKVHGPGQTVSVI